MNRPRIRARTRTATCLGLLAGAGCAPPADSPPDGAAGGVDWQAAQVETVDLSELFEGIDGEATFVLLDAAAGRVRIHDPGRARRRFLPASTFKIPNSLVALESGVAGGPDFALAFDSVATPPQPWWPASWTGDQTMRAAFRNSVVWYYQELARRVGPERMAGWLERLDYGNREVSPEVDRFWLDGGLRISAEEQVEFLRRLWTGELPVSRRSAATVRDLMRLDEGDGWRLSGKTGTAELKPTRELGWLVGAVESTEGDYPDVRFFALNVEGERVWEEWPPDRRAELVKRILRRLDALPPAAPPFAAGDRGCEPERPAVSCAPGAAPVIIASLGRSAGGEEEF